MIAGAFRLRDLSVFFLVWFISFSAPATNVEQEDGSTNAVKKWQPVTSHNRNFVVTGMPKSDALQVAAWAENVYQRLSDWAQSPVPGNFAYPLIITAEIRDPDSPGKAQKLQEYSDDGHLRQQMLMINPSSMDQEDALEALCNLLLNRWIQVRLPAGTRHETPGDFPEWFATGIAQNLYPELKSRNFNTIKNAERNDEYMPASAVLSYVFLSPGRWPEKAHSGLVMAWLAEAVAPSRLLALASDHLVQHEAIDENTVLQWLNLETRREFDMNWDLWMARQSKRLIPGVLSSDTDGITRILEMRPDDIGLVFPGALPRDRLTPELLIKARKDTWAKEACRVFSWNLKQEMIGKTSEMMAQVQGFITFYDEISRPAPTGRRKVKPAIMSDRQLRNLWTETDRQWADYLRKSSDRHAYLDGYSERLQSSSESDTNTLRQMMQKWESIQR